MNNSQIKQLLTNRFKIIADYPLAPGPVGSIITMSIHPKFDDSEGYLSFPHLFKKLEWWEERVLAEMPLYVKNTKTKEVYRLMGCEPSILGLYARLRIGDRVTTEEFKTLIPATQEEYEQQNINSIEHTLRIRYQLIANYPGNIHPIGFIYNPPLESSQIIRDWCEEKEKYPQVFKRLEWWEYRTDSELPRYMKYADNPEFVFLFIASHKWHPGKIYVRDGENHESWEHIKNMFPATEYEFKNQPRYKD